MTSFYFCRRVSYNINFIIEYGGHYIQQDDNRESRVRHCSLFSARFLDVAYWMRSPHLVVFTVRRYSSPHSVYFIIWCRLEYNMFATGAATPPPVLRRGLRREHRPHAPLRTAPTKIKLIRRRRTHTESHRSILHFGPLQKCRELR